MRERSVAERPGAERPGAERPGAERASTLRILTTHFFRRFFDNDTVQPEGDTQTTVVRAIAIVAAPGLIIAFWMQNKYAWLPMWDRIDVRCFFVVFSFVVIGAAAVFEWEMLFPDKLDFLVLTPLPIRPIKMFAAKTAALAGFLGLFVVATNLFSALILPHPRLGPIFRQIVAHLIATAGAGAFAALLVLAIGGVMLCMLSARAFRLALPVLQMLSVMALMLLLFAYLRFTGAIPQLLLQQPLGAARWLPPLWFMGLYEQMLHGGAAPAFAAVMARYAMRATAMAAVVVLLTYPLAWARVRKMTIEDGARRRGGGRSRVLEWLTARAVRQPGERAVFHFIGQTIARNDRYQVYLAIYCGVGLALAVSFAVSLRVVGDVVRLGLSDYGLHAVMPMLLFWAIAGLRTAFAFPVNLQAGWIFRATGVDLRDCAAAARRWVGLCAGCVMAGVLVAQRLAGWDARKLLVQAVCGLGLCVLLTDGFFFAQRSVPFNQPRMPGKVSFPLMLTLYIGVYPQFVIGMSMLEMRLEQHLMRLVLVALVAAALHLIAVALRGLSSEVEDNAEYDGEFQLLGLTTQ
jgi:hypothetical protein